MIALIACLDNQGGLGRNGKMAWHIPAELAHFRKLTLDHTLLMGYTTYRNLFAVLDRRQLVVLTRKQTVADEGISFISDPKPFLEHWQREKETLMVAGGASVYRLALPYAQELLLSFLKESYDCDCFFPIGWQNQFVLTEQRDHGEFVFCRFRRKDKPGSMRNKE